MDRRLGQRFSRPNERWCIAREERLLWRCWKGRCAPLLFFVKDPGMNAQGLCRSSIAVQHTDEGVPL